MWKYRKAISKAARKYSNVIVIDGTKLASDAEMHSYKYTNDKLHPKQRWAKKTIAKRLRNALNARRDRFYAYQKP
jgi:hypothetical protein